MTLETPNGWTLPLTLTVACTGKIPNCMVCITHEKDLKAFLIFIPGEGSLKISLLLDWFNAVFTDSFNAYFFGRFVCLLFF